MELTITKGQNGLTYAASNDINEVRSALLMRGFRCDQRRGWVRDADNAVSAIFYTDNRWTAVVDQ